MLETIYFIKNIIYTGSTSIVLIPKSNILSMTTVSDKHKHYNFYYSKLIMLLINAKGKLHLLK